MASNTDQGPHGPGDPDGQKVRVYSGTTGAKMAAEGAAASSQGGPAGSDNNMMMRTNNSSPSTHFTTITTSTNTSTNTNSPAGDRRHLINRDEFSGLQVVEPGLEVSHSTLPEALPPSDPEAQYAEYKASPQAVLPPPHRDGGWPLPEAVSPGAGGGVDNNSNNLYTPVSQPYSKTSSATYGHSPFEAEKQEQGARERRICGLRRVVFWCVLAVVVFVIVAGVAVGVGVGLGTRDNSSGTSATPTSDSSSVPSATATAVATASSSIVCPYANRTSYSLESRPDKSFLVLCGRDYNSCCGAVDMLTVNTTSFEDCLEQCGGQEGCTAVGWGNYYGVNTCWLKSAYGEPNWSGSWYAAVLV